MASFFNRSMRLCVGSSIEAVLCTYLPAELVALMLLGTLICTTTSLTVALVVPEVTEFEIMPSNESA